MLDEKRAAEKKMSDRTETRERKYESRKTPRFEIKRWPDKKILGH